MNNDPLSVGSNESQEVHVPAVTDNSVWAHNLRQYIANRYTDKNANAVQIKEHVQVRKLFDALKNRQFEEARKKSKVVGMRLLYGTARTGIGRPEFDLLDPTAVYDAEPFVRAAITRQLNIWFKHGFKFHSTDPKLAEYITRRFRDIAFVTGIHTRELFKMIVRDLLKYSNAFLIKYRNEDLAGLGRRKDGMPMPVAGYFPVSALNMFPRFNEGRLVGWIRYLDDGTVYNEISPKDVIHLTFDLEPDFMFGKPRLLGAIEDVAALRRIEENVEILLVKYLFPLFQFTVGTEDAPAQYLPDGISELEMAKEMLEEMNQEGMLVGTERHKLEVVGAKNQAMDAKNYLAHFKSRVLIALGVSPLDLGEGDTANRACYSADTETLTDHGWKMYWEIQPTDKIATFNPTNNAIEFHKPNGEVYLYKYSGPMTHFKNRNIDVMVTPDHDMWVGQPKLDGSQNWERIHADGISQWQVKFRSGGLDWKGIAPRIFTLPYITYDCYNEQPNDKPFKIQMSDWLEFLGYYVSEGTLAKSQGRWPVSISQNSEVNPEKTARIRSCLNRLPFNFKEYTDQKDHTTRFWIHCKSLYLYLKKNCGDYSHTKRFPSWVLNLSQALLNIVFRAAMLGDGTIDKRSGRTSQTYYSNSEVLLDQMQEMAIKQGVRAHILPGQRCKRLAMSVARVSNITKDHISIVNYDDYVYCFNVPNHLFITRRNGRIGIHGNTADNISQNLKERVMEDQQSLISQVQQKMIAELLLEHPEDISAVNSFDKVQLFFGEVDLDNKIKRENHYLNLWNNDAITEDELRAEIGLLPMSPEQRSNTRFALIDVPLAIISAVDEPFTKEARQAVRTRTAEVGAGGNEPKNRQGPKPGTGSSTGGGKGKTKTKRPGSPTTRGPANVSQPTNQFGRNPGPTRRKSSLERELLGDRLTNLISLLIFVKDNKAVETAIDERFKKEKDRNLLKKVFSQLQWDTIDMVERRATLISEFLHIAHKFPENQDD